MDIRSFKNKSQSQAKENKKFLQRLKKSDPRTIDRQFHTYHDEVFEEIDCLECANCCKTTSPIFYPADIERLAKFLKLKPGSFIKKYLKIDEDDDFVLKTSPCPFLGEDNSCRVYNERPKACREYPHTNRKKMTQLLDLTYRNTLVCPAVLEIVNRMKTEI